MSRPSGVGAPWRDGSRKFRNSPCCPAAGSRRDRIARQPVAGLAEGVRASCGVSTITVLDHDTRHWPLNALRTRITYVDQTFTLLEATARENLQLGRTTPATATELAIRASRPLCRPGPWRRPNLPRTTQRSRPPKAAANGMPNRVPWTSPGRRGCRCPRHPRNRWRPQPPASRPSSDRGRHRSPPRRYGPGIPLPPKGWGLVHRGRARRSRARRHRHATRTIGPDHRSVRLSCARCPHTPTAPEEGPSRWAKATARAPPEPRRLPGSNETPAQPHHHPQHGGQPTPLSRPHNHPTKNPPQPTRATLSR